MMDPKIFVFYNDMYYPDKSHYLCSNDRLPLTCTQEITTELASSFYKRYKENPFIDFVTWRHAMEALSALLAICEGEYTGHQWIPNTSLQNTNNAEL